MKRWDDGTVANGEPPLRTAGADTNGSGPSAEPTPVDAPTTEFKLDTAHEPEPKAAEEAPKAPTARATLAALATSIVSALAALAASIASAAPQAALLAKRWLTRLIEFRPSPLLTMAILGVVAALGIVGGLAHPNSAIGQACAIVFVPGLSIALGVVAHRWYSKQGPYQQSASTDYPTLDEQRSLRFIDDRLSAAQRHLQNGHIFGALIESVRAKTATELALGNAHQPSYHGEYGSATREPAAQAFFTDDDDEPSETTALATTVREPNEGSVARVEDQYTLIINRGSEHGVKSGMDFAVMSERGDRLIDPETGEVIGELPIEKLRVKVLDVHPKYSRAEIFRTSGALGSLATSLSKRQEISHEGPVGTTDLPEVTVNIGDKVRYVSPRRRAAR
ncbi:hypothetical protein [Mycobacterium sp.]|uniref:hypothetical protein n=1 Tax=Mycobacterium sp. TaxID=1785 RepID=UPI002BF26622|nr:hypothetical protein [Mycobacterium sp.]HTQ21393.1 hypothetical protein [Mycobacterium sp.]